MGGIKPHGKGIQITFYWNGERFRPTLGIPSTPTNLKYAERLKAEIERAISLGTYSLDQYASHFPTSRTARSVPKDNASITFSDIAKNWLKSITHLGAGTQKKYQQALAFWVDKVGDEPIDSIKYSTLAAYANSQGWEPKNRNNILIPLRQVMEMASLDGLIAGNPTSRIKNGKVQKKPPDPLTAEEVQLVLNHMGKYSPQIVNYFEFAFFSGMRPSELISLKWGDIDEPRGLARVQRARTFGKEHETKTYIVRDVELNSMAKNALLRQKQHTLLKDGYVFDNPVTGEPFTEERPLRRAYWNPTLKALKMRARNFYQTRHTYATLNLMAGANPMWVAKQLGHANMQMVLTVYAKWIEGADKSQEMAKLEGKLSGIATRTPLNAANQS
jgi:integrase